MSNKEQYKKAFSVLQTSDDFTLEDGKMAILKKKAMMKTFAAAAAACLIVVIGSKTAYAATVFGIQRTIQLWMNGDQTDVTISFDGAGNYSMEYADEEGNLHESRGGGVAIEADGTERPLTEDEILSDMSDGLDVRFDDDGNVFVDFQDHVIDITDKFENDICYVFLDGADKDLYLTVMKEDDGIRYATSPDKYMQYREIWPGMYVAD